MVFSIKENAPALTLVEVSATGGQVAAAATCPNGEYTVIAMLGSTTLGSMKVVVGVPPTAAIFTPVSQTIAQGGILPFTVSYQPENADALAVQIEVEGTTKLAIHAGRIAVASDCPEGKYTVAAKLNGTVLERMQVTVVAVASSATIDPEQMEIGQGSSKHFTVTFLPAQENGAGAFFLTSEPKLSVKPGVNVGEFILSATADCPPGTDYKVRVSLGTAQLAEMRISVVELLAPTKATFAPAELTLEQGKSGDFALTYEPEGADATGVTFVASDAKVTVEGNKVTVAEDCPAGSYTVKAMLDGTELGSLTVKVTAKKVAKKINAVESTALAGVEVYPNPATDWLYVSAESSILRYELYTVRGEKVLESLADGDVKINVAGLPQGLYLLRLIAAGQEAIRPILIGR